MNRSGFGIFALLGAVLRNRKGLAFTLIEATVTAAIMGILAGVAIIGYESTRTGQDDRAGYTLLGAVQSEGRKVASTAGYTFPENLVDQLQKMGGSTFTSQSSTAPEELTSGAFNVSVTSNPAASAAGYAVMSSPGHCQWMIDRTKVPNMKVAATVWGIQENAVTCQVMPQCLENNNFSSMPGDGTQDNPYQGSPDCAALDRPNPASPSCLVPTVKKDADNSPVKPPAVNLTWTAPRSNSDTSNTVITGYRVYKYLGAPNFTSNNAANDAINILPTSFATAGTGNEATASAGVELTVENSGAWEGTTSYTSLVPVSASNGTTIIASPTTTKALPTAGESTILSFWASKELGSNSGVVVKPKIEWLRSDGSPASTPYVLGSPKTLTRVWSNIQLTTTVPVGADKAKVSLILDSSNTPITEATNVYTDAFDFESGSQVAPVTLPTPSSVFEVSGRTTTAYTDTEVVNGDSYTYAVVSVSATPAPEKVSDIQDLIASQQTLPSITVPPAGATNVGAIQIQVEELLTKDLKVSWDKVENSTGYEIARKLKNEADTAYQIIGTVPASEATSYSYTDTTTVPMTSYSYRVRGTVPQTAYSICGATSVDATAEWASPPPPKPRPNSPRLEGKANSTTVANELWWTPRAPVSATDKFEVSFKSAESGSWIPARSNSSPPTWASCGGNTTTAVTNDPSICLYGGDLRSGGNTNLLAHITSSGGTTTYSHAVSDSQVVPGSKISYKVRTVSAITNEPGEYSRSCWSNEVPVDGTTTCTEVSAEGLQLTQPLSVPQVTAVGDAESGKSTLTWEPVPGATGYAVYRLPGLNAAFPTGGPTDVTSLAWDSTPLVGTWSAPGNSIKSPTAGTTGNFKTVDASTVVFEQTDGVPSQQTYAVFAIRIATGVFSGRNASNTNIKDTNIFVHAPATKCSPPAEGTTPPTNIVSWNKVPGATNYTLYGYTTPEDALEDAKTPENPTRGILMTSGANIDNYSHDLTDVSKPTHLSWLYRVFVTSGSGSTVAYDASGDSSPFCGVALKNPEVTVSFTDPDGNGISNDEVVSWNGVPLATNYAAFPSEYVTCGTGPNQVLATPVVAQDQQFNDYTFSCVDKAGSTIYLLPVGSINPESGTHPNVQTDAYTRLPANPVNASYAVGATNVTGVSATWPQLNKKQVYTSPGVLAKYYASVIPLHVTSENIVDNASMGVGSGSPVVGTMPAPQNVTARTKIYDDRAIPVVSWSNSAAVAEWFSQPYLANLIQVRCIGGPCSSTGVSLAVPNAGTPSFSLAATQSTTQTSSVGGGNLLPDISYDIHSITYDVRYLYTTASGEYTGTSVAPSASTMTPPSSPVITGSLRAQKGADNDVMLTFTQESAAMQNPDLYTIWRSNPKQPGGTWVKVADVAGNDHNYTEWNLPNAASYTYIVQAVNYGEHGLATAYSRVNVKASFNDDGTAKTRNIAGLYVLLKDTSAGFYRGRYIPGGPTASYEGSYRVRGVEGYCIDFLNNSPGEIPSSAYRSAASRVKDDNLPYGGSSSLDGSVPKVNVRNLAYALARYGSGGGNAWAYGTDHYVRTQTVSGTWQKNYEARRWAAMNNDSATVNAYNAIKAASERLYGPYYISWGSGALQGGVYGERLFHVGSSGGVGVGGLVYFPHISNGWPSQWPIATNGGGDVAFGFVPDWTGYLTFSGSVLSLPDDLYVFKPDPVNIGQRLLMSGRQVWASEAGVTTVGQW